LPAKPGVTITPPEHHNLLLIRKTDGTLINMQTFSNQNGGIVVQALIKAVCENKQYLSDLDGAIGDGDHGVNMAKGFSLCGKTLANNPGGFSHSFKILGNTLLNEVGGSMGPLYGSFFRAAARASKDHTDVDGQIFSEVLSAARAALESISEAKVGDKTMMDCLVPAEHAYRQAVEGNTDFANALDAMSEAAVKGRDATKEMIARVGRSSRLGERSRGALDPGAVSCCLILTTMAEQIKEILVCSE
jgi:phosphoenolpyruvate---glycerone phosphotransferase subunit DhaL